MSFPEIEVLEHRMSGTGETWVSLSVTLYKGRRLTAFGRTLDEAWDEWMRRMAGGWSD